MKISALTPTAERPVAFALCESMMRRQTRQPDEWIVADGGRTPAVCTLGQRHVHDARPPGAANFINNLLNGMAIATGDVLVIFEDDDWYAKTHIQAIESLARARPAALLLGAAATQPYYNVADRMWRMSKPVGASLCQTAIPRASFPLLTRMLRAALGKQSFSVDVSLWLETPRARWALAGSMTVIGIKGLPGAAGLGIGHRPGNGWTADPRLVKLREWIGDDAETYRAFALARV